MLAKTEPCARARSGSGLGTNEGSRVSEQLRIGNSANATLRRQARGGAKGMRESSFLTFDALSVKIKRQETSPPSLFVERQLNFFHFVLLASYLAVFLACLSAFFSPFFISDFLSVLHRRGAGWTRQGPRPGNGDENRGDQDRDQLSCFSSRELRIRL